MFAGNSILNTNDFDKVLQILELVGDPPKTKRNVEHVRKLQVEFERLAADQAKFAQARDEHNARATAMDKELAAREAELARRENVVKAAEAQVANLENDLRRRLALLKSAAA